MMPPRLDRWISVHVVSRWLRLARRDADDAIPILMYHSISDDPEPGVAPYYRLATPPALFHEHMRMLSEGGYDGCSLSTALPAITGARPPCQRIVVITFDDGLRDFQQHAWPILLEFGFTATMFLPTAFIGEDRRQFKGRECLTWDEVRALHGQGVEFGSHTVHHLQLADLAPEAMTRELSQSRSDMEEGLGEPPQAFSHPYAFPLDCGGYVRRLQSALRAEGYRAAVTTRLGRSRPGDDPLLLKRLPCNGDDDLVLLKAKLLGAYDWLGAIQYAVKCAKRMTGGR